MADELDQALSDYENLVAEYARVAGPLDTFGRFIQDGIEIEDFARSKSGQLLIAKAHKVARDCIAVLVHEESTPVEVRAAVMELRVQHRVLQSFADVIKTGRDAQRRLELEDSVADQSEEDSDE